MMGFVAQTNGRTHPAIRAIRLPLEDSASRAARAAYTAVSTEKPESAISWPRENPLVSLAAARLDLPSDSRADNFVTAQQQLGLNLESAQAPAQALFLDQLELPTEN